MLEKNKKYVMREIRGPGELVVSIGINEEIPNYDRVVSAWGTHLKNPTLSIYSFPVKRRRIIKKDRDGFGVRPPHIFLQTLEGEFHSEDITLEENPQEYQKLSSIWAKGNN